MTLSSVTAFCPGHISGYFRRVNGTDPATTGSIGAGIVINEGVTATVRPGKESAVTVQVRDQEGKIRVAARESPPVSFALDRLGVTAEVTTVCRLPIGAGFGLSAAALLATLTAANRLFGLERPAEEIAGLAHETEVLFRTGLGDVSACQGGGRVVRASPGIHGNILRSFDLIEPVSAVSFGPIHTPSVLGSPSQMEQVAAAFPKNQPSTVKEFFACCREFSRASGLETPFVQRVLARCDDNGIAAAMTMLGEGVFAYGNHAPGTLQEFGEVYVMGMARDGIQILEVSV